MRKYGASYSKLIKIVRRQGSGCYYCTLEKKATKSATRHKAKLEIKKAIPNRKKNASRLSD